MKRRMAVSCCACVLSFPVVAWADQPLPVLRSQVRNPASQAALERALPGAARKLADPACARVLTDFTDDSGRPLRENLEALGRTPAEYLGLIVFADGHLRASCRNGSNLAVTAPGSRVVYVCPQFAHARARSDAYRANILIHEALHTLGLQENPPSTGEITERVEARCGR